MNIGVWLFQESKIENEASLFFFFFWMAKFFLIFQDQFILIFILFGFFFFFSYIKNRFPLTKLQS